MHKTKICTTDKAIGCRTCFEARKQVVRDVINLLGGPVMDYSPSNAVKEYEERIKKSVEQLTELLK